MSLKLIAQGAEAKIYLDNKNKTILKERLSKSYRLPSLDHKIRGQRTRAEFKILEKAKFVIPVPNVILDEDNRTLKLEYIDGKKLSQYLDEFPKAKRNQICKLIGKQLALLHNNHIIHGDLTTSNMILNEKNKKLYFIDFGLSYIDSKIEHKAVDLHLIKQAIESKHYKHFEESFKNIISSYKENANDANKILERFEIVELRGRYKHK